MFNKFLRKDQLESKTGFRYRGLESSRLENLTDAVFAFAITLLVVASEVPSTYVELQASMYGFIGFLACIFLLLGIWNNHANFFMYYGLRSGVIKPLNYFFLFVLLFYIYPLKYLFSFVSSVLIINFSQDLGIVSEGLKMATEKAILAELTVNQWQDLTIRFGLGLLLIYGTLGIMYYTAYKKRDLLELNEREVFETKSFIINFALLVLISVSSILIVLTFGGMKSDIAGFVYFLIPVILPLVHSLRNKRMNKLYPLHDVVGNQ